MASSAIQFSFTPRAAILVKQNQVVSGTVAVPPASVLPAVGDSISLRGGGGNSYGFTVIDRMFHFSENQARLVILLDVLRQNSPFALNPTPPAVPAPVATDTARETAATKPSRGGKKGATKDTSAKT